HLLEEIVAFEQRVVDDREECLAWNPLHDRATQERLPGADLAGDDNQRFASPERVGELLESRRNRGAGEQESRIRGKAEGRLLQSEKGIVFLHRNDQGPQKGFTNAPFPATSHTATRAQVQPFALIRHSNCRLPNSRVSTNSMTSRCVVWPSPQTISAKRSGNVHCARTRATISPADDDAKFTSGRSTSPVVVKKAPVARGTSASPHRSNAGR